MTRVDTVAAGALVAALLTGCGGGTPSSPSTPPSTNPPGNTTGTATLTITYGENPTPYRADGCNAAIPQGWYTTATIRETAGVALSVTTLVQKLDGAVSSDLSETFNSRFGACAGGSFVPGSIPANGSVCGSVGICTTRSFGSYQFQLSGTDANGHAVSVDSPVLQFGAR